MLLFMLSLGGIPPTAGFMGKLWVFGAAIDAGYIWLAVIGVLNSAVSLYYYARVVVFMWMSPPDAASAPFRVSPALAAVLIVTVAGTIVLGVYPRLLFELAEASASTLGAAPVHSGYDRSWTRSLRARAAAWPTPSGRSARSAPSGSPSCWRSGSARCAATTSTNGSGPGPGCFLLFILFGLAAGILNVYRTADRFLK